MDKPKYRYNHKTKEWDMLYRFNTNVIVMPGNINPQTGIPVSFSLPINCPLADFYMLI